MSDHPNSKHPVIAEINRLVYQHFPPTKRDGYWTYGKLYYYSDTGLIGVGFSPSWILDGITPVAESCVLRILEQRGEDVGRFRFFFDEIYHARAEEEACRRALRATAATKLTAEECAACGLTP